jgi:hypothetical protein
MYDSGFFAKVRQFQVPWSGGTACNPTFYRDFTGVDLAFLTPTKHVLARLPSRRMKPLRMTPWHAITVISLFEYRDTDIGPYNEVCMSFPITLDKPAGLLLGAMRELNRGPMAYIWHLPVTTEIARDLGIEAANYPKFLADIEFGRENGWLSCHLSEGSRDILTISVRELDTKPRGHSRVYPITFRDDYILRCEEVFNMPQFGQSQKSADARLELGDHSIAEELRGLKLGRLLRIQYMPHNQAILTPPLESYPM